MVIFPNCKINLGLNVIRKRADGYHDIETLFYPVAITDVLEIITAEKFQMTVTGIPIDFPGENICLRAYHLLKKDHPDLPAIKIHLHKIIPVGAGLGGGSANGAFTLMLLNKKYNLQIPQEKLYDYALELGSDCSFFILDKPAMATGRGEILEELDLSLSEYQLMVINPGIHINTSELFRQIVPKKGLKNIKDIIQSPVTEWKNNLVNDFEPVVFSKYPVIKELKERMYSGGAVYASMTGTGSSVFGLFPKDDVIDFLSHHDYFQRIITL